MTMVHAKINDITYDVTDGAVFIDNYNETLDSGTILIQQLASRPNIQPYDHVEITGDNILTRNMLVDTVTTSQISIQPAIYKCEISLFSLTKLLEGVLLPNLKITRIPDRPLSVYAYIMQYLGQYCPKTDSNDTYGAYGDAWIPGDELYDRFENIECPEMQWNTPTLREVLTDLMMVDDCIPILRMDDRGNIVLSCIDISEEGDAADTDGINYITESHSSEDYVSELKMHLVNAANNSHMDPYVPDDASRIIEKIGFRNDESYILTTENMRLETSFPIWKVFRCEIAITGKVAIQYLDQDYEQQSTVTDDPISVTVDLTPYILEHAEWLTKDVFYGAWQQGPQQLTTDYRNTCLFYTRGAKNIENFNGYYQTQTLFIDTTYVFDLILRSQDVRDASMAAAQEYLDSQGISYQEIVSAAPIGVDYKNVEFTLEYEAIDDCVFSASKSPIQTHRRVVMDNQTNSYIDTRRQGLLEYMKANRLGNKMAHINGRYEGSESTMPTLGQTIEGKIIFRKEISVYYDHIDANFLATENYVLRDYFTGVKAKLRSWRVISGQEALVRAEHIKFYVNDDLASPDGKYIFPSVSNPDLYLSWFKHCAIRFDTSDDWKPTNTAYKGTTYQINAIAVEFTKHRVGDSAVFTIRMPDNFYAGNYVSDYSNPDAGNRCEQKGIGYTDDNGRIIGGVVYFFDTVNPHWFGNTDSEAARALKPLCIAATDKDDQSGDTFKAADMMARIPFRINKDNGEILQLSIQFEANEDANDVFLGHKDIQ